MCSQYLFKSMLYHMKPLQGKKQNKQKQRNKPQNNTQHLCLYKSTWFNPRVTLSAALTHCCPVPSSRLEALPCFQGYVTIPFVSHYKTSSLCGSSHPCCYNAVCNFAFAYDTPWFEQYTYHGWSGVNHLGPVWWEGNWNYTIALQVIHSISSLIFTGIHSHLNDMFIGTSFTVKESYCGHGLNSFSHYILQAAVKCQTRVELGLNSLSIKSPSYVTKTDLLKSLQATSLIS